MHGTGPSFGSIDIYKAYFPCEGCGSAHRERIQELLHFINSQPRTITEFDEALVKKLLESVKVCEFFLEFRFKSGVTISIEK